MQKDATAAIATRLRECIEQCPDGGVSFNEILDHASLLGGLSSAVDNARRDVAERCAETLRTLAGEEVK